VEKKNPQKNLNLRKADEYAKKIKGDEASDKGTSGAGRKNSMGKVTQEEKGKNLQTHSPL